jgi:hypothetical protein
MCESESEVSGTRAAGIILARPFDHSSRVVGIHRILLDVMFMDQNVSTS